MTDAVTTPLTDRAERLLRLTIAPEITARYPDCHTAVVMALGVDNSGPWAETESELAALEAEVADGRRRMPDEDHPAIAAWHGLLRSFGTNPRRMRPSVDALGRRLARSRRLPRISPLVDTCNLVSLRYTLPTGGYDLEQVRHGFTLRYARPDDVHIPLGQPEERETPLPNEVVYADGRQVLTRHWNHRDADNTKVTHATVDAVLFLEGVSPAIGPDVLEKAQRELADRVAPHASSVSLHAFDPAQETTVAWTPTR
ncbi:B3/B4 domain-containing protein [Streptomyces sp. HD]|uniref:B3/B4 domain-containing protein n=1 Tax=Streptomyces sp. HD TaxID=3020892 RepID=UPI00232CA019|nr:phenylalanine--tRNA ligase beta subunit-related protein [Streptomyces sp. HD]MDC0766033.1 phenylalanine--tRNA ligase beta subunit-related protein [Streptomyces sp. HD]